MSALPQVKTPLISPEEYLRRERVASTKSEYLDGQVFAMAGASRRHNQLLRKALVLLDSQLGDTPCEAFFAELRVRTPGDGLYTYPDIAVACPPQFQDQEFDTLINPTVIFEILSPSTEKFDRGEKFNRYRTIPSLRDYILIDQDQMLVEHRSRSQQTDEDHWWLRVLVKPEEELVLDSINCRVQLSDLYERLDLSP